MAQRKSRPAFTLIDVLVSIAVVAVLIGVMLPSMSRVREATRRVVCGSNLRQIGIGLHTYGNDYRGMLPWSMYLESDQGSWESSTDPGAFVSLRLESVPLSVKRANSSGWDGLGLLYAQDYLPAGALFYCPSHRSGVDFEAYAKNFGSAQPASVLGNYRFRGEGPNGQRDLFLIDSSVAVASDSFGMLGWLNHQDGMNILRAGNSVGYDREQFAAITDSIAAMAGDPGDSQPRLKDTWRLLDGDNVRGGN